VYNDPYWDVRARPPEARAGPKSIRDGTEETQGAMGVGAMVARCPGDGAPASGAQQIEEAVAQRGESLRGAPDTLLAGTLAQRRVAHSTHPRPTNPKGDPAPGRRCRALWGSAQAPGPGRRSSCGPADGGGDRLERRAVRRMCRGHVDSFQNVTDPIFRCPRKRLFHNPAASSAGFPNRDQTGKARQRRREGSGHFTQGSPHPLPLHSEIAKEPKWVNITIALNPPISTRAPANRRVVAHGAAA
jgi:hypothetical protein